VNDVFNDSGLSSNTDCNLIVLTLQNYLIVIRKTKKNYKLFHVIEIYMKIIMELKERKSPSRQLLRANRMDKLKKLRLAMNKSNAINAKKTATKKRKKNTKQNAKTARGCNL